jgi:hypothetical protein
VQLNTDGRQSTKAKIHAQASHWSRACLDPHKPTKADLKPRPIRIRVSDVLPWKYVDSGCPEDNHYAGLTRYLSLLAFLRYPSGRWFTCECVELYGPAHLERHVEWKIQYYANSLQEIGSVQVHELACDKFWC